MPSFAAFQLTFALWLMPSPQSAGPFAPAELPSGSSTAFRERMMAWSAPALTPSAQPVARVHAQRKLPRLSSGFGYRSDPMRGTRRMHSGVDIAGPLGTPIQASAGGIVRFAGRAGSYGRMIEVDHQNGLSTRYAHLSEILVHSGMPVAQGETIALMGSTGRSTGSHLHFEVRANGQVSNPLRYLGGEAPPGRVRQAPATPHISNFARAAAAVKARATGS